MPFSEDVQNVISIVLFVMRILVPALSIAILVGCFLSLKRGRRKEEPVVLLEDVASGISIPVLYWENSIGRSKSCDIVLPDNTVSRDHAVLMRREHGWIITDTNSKAGTLLNGKRIKGDTVVLPGDVLSIGSSSLMLKRVSEGVLPKNSKAARAQEKAAKARIRIKRAPSPTKLMIGLTVVQTLLAAQCSLADGKFSWEPLISFGILVFLSWGMYLFSTSALHRVSFEVETVGLLLSSVGIMLLTGIDLKPNYTQLIGLCIGIVLFCFLIWFMGDLERVMKWRMPIAITALLLFAVNLVIGSSVHGSKNWIMLGPVSIQPSEFIKIAFIFTGASTLNKLQTTRNLTVFLVFTALCMGALFLMKDLGTASVFFITFLVIAFMRSGSIRTIILVLAAAALGAFLLMQFMPHITNRFEAWRHVWDYADTSGYQQTRVLMYAASGGMFGIGLGQGYLHQTFAGDSDLVFGMLCEEMGLLMAMVVVIGIALLIIFARSDVTRSRSTFYSISSCATAGLLIFQTCLNIFGSTDILPLTGVTLPFISAGGSSIMAVWGLLAFIKASDERTYAVSRRAAKQAPRRPTRSSQPHSATRPQPHPPKIRRREV
ncbi:MAG: FtsW/RodA/SpoVE family cell cycle protein [Clostridiales bacterium]|jgi:cell division protein FtsW|nr:FtsW/RodA/SpoVE family cell cycle protein [Clostridiales bacterium]